MSNDILSPSYVRCAYKGIAMAYKQSENIKHFENTTREVNFDYTDHSTERTQCLLRVRLNLCNYSLNLKKQPKKWLFTRSILISYFKNR